MKRLALFCTMMCMALVMPVVAQADDNMKETAVTAAQFETELQYVTDSTYKYANAEGINIRKEPNTDCEVLAQTLLNTEFEVVLDISGWSMITTEDGYAYIKSDYLSDTESPDKRYVGKFKITHYCCEPYKHICGTGSGVTASGIKVRPGLISVDPNIIPLGSVVVINGEEYLAADTGGMIKGRKIDMAVMTHEEAINLGVYYADVYIK